jgi:hypothetical protein
MIYNGDTSQWPDGRYIDTGFGTFLLIKQGTIATLYNAKKLRLCWQTTAPRQVLLQYKRISDEL